jgi:predicted dehydrogenase
LYDIGCYAIVAGRFLFESEPLRVVALMDRDPEFRTDRTVTAIVDFGGGRRLDFTVSTQSVPYQRVQAIGTQQRLELEIPFNAPLGGSTRIFVDDASAPGGASAVAEVIAPCDMYTLQGDAFSQVIRGEIPLPYGLDDAICNMKIIDALFKSDLNGQWVDV